MLLVRNTALDSTTTAGFVAKYERPGIFGREICRSLMTPPRTVVANKGVRMSEDFIVVSKKSGIEDELNLSKPELGTIDEGMNNICSRCRLAQFYAITGRKDCIALERRLAIAEEAQVVRKQYMLTCRRTRSLLT